MDSSFEVQVGAKSTDGWVDVAEGADVQLSTSLVDLHLENASCQSELAHDEIVKQEQVSCQGDHSVTSNSQILQAWVDLQGASAEQGKEHPQDGFAQAKEQQQEQGAASVMHHAEVKPKEVGLQDESSSTLASGLSTGWVDLQCENAAHGKEQQEKHEASIAQADQTRMALDVIQEHDQIVASEDGVVSGFGAVVSVVAPSVIAKRTPVALVAVIDRSGSMSGSKLTMTLKTLRFVLTQLRDADSFGLVSYSSDVRVDIPLTHCTPESKIRMEATIQSIKAGGSTNLSGGLLRGIDMQRESQCETEKGGADCVRSVFLLTDGHANAGMTTRDAITAAAQASLAEMHPYQSASIHCFGFGSDHNALMLRAIAEKGSGTYFYIKNDEMIAAEFAGALGGLLSTVLQSVTLRLKSPFLTLQTGLPFSVAEDGTHTVELGDLFADEHRDVLLELKPSPSEGQEFVVGSTAFLCEAWVRGFCLATNSWQQQGPISLTAEVVATCHQLCAEKPLCVLGVARQRNRFKATQAMEAALQAAEKGHLRNARNYCTAALRDIKSTELFRKEDPLTLKLVSDLRACRESMVDPEAYNTIGEKTLTSCTMSHTIQAHSDFYRTCEQENMTLRSMTYMSQ